MKERLLTIAGIELDVFTGDKETVDTTKPVLVLFLLHGRLESRKERQPLAQNLLDLTDAHNASLTHDIVVVAFDQRNHGHRLANATNNDGWHKKPAKNNPTHALDMYAIQTGTAADVSFLIDFLPSYLYPQNERVIDTWAVTGVSLGGHSTWICLKNEPRITIGIPIIGCPDYLALMTYRGAQFGHALNSPALPTSLVQHISLTSPASTLSALPKEQNPLSTKKILVLSGAADTLVPWSASEPFVNQLDVNEEQGGVKRVWVQEGVGHQCTQEMMVRMSEFVLEVGAGVKKEVLAAL